LVVVVVEILVVLLPVVQLVCLVVREVVQVQKVVQVDQQLQVKDSMVEMVVQIMLVGMVVVAAAAQDKLEVMLHLAVLVLVVMEQHPPYRVHQ
jgi:hypothetical protein